MPLPARHRRPPDASGVDRVSGPLPGGAVTRRRGSDPAAKLLQGPAGVPEGRGHLAIAATHDAGPSRDRPQPTPQGGHVLGQPTGGRGSDHDAAIMDKNPFSF